VHVTLRAAFRPLRSEHVFPTVCLAIRGAMQRDPRHFRVLHFSVQWDHVHLIVEARDKLSLSEGMRSLSIRIARYVNELLMRRGRFWADRWHGRELASPREVRNALLYVLANFRKHAKRPVAPGFDPFSSGREFDGWRAVATGACAPRAGPRHHDLAAHVVVAVAKTWLARVGWRSSGLLRLDEAPRVK
jgi:REP element-mobilizing transposase RayT